MPRRRSGGERLRSALLWWTGIALAVLIWHAAARTQPQYVLPGPRTTWTALLGLIRDEELGAALLLTVERGAVGLGISCLIGLPLGWAMGTWSWLRELLDSWVQVLMSVPPIVIVVVGMIWLGPTAGVVVLVVALVTLPLLTTAVRDAVAAIPPETYAPLRVLGATFAQIVRHIIVPASLPKFITAVRVAMATAISVLFFTETFGTQYGIGYYIMDAWLRVNYLDMYAGITVLSTMGLLLFILLDWTERRLCAWNQ